MPHLIDCEGHIWLFRKIGHLIQSCYLALKRTNTDLRIKTCTHFNINGVINFIQ